MTKFKKGDQVIILNAPTEWTDSFLTIGKIYTVGGRYYQYKDFMLAVEECDTGKPEAFSYSELTVAPAQPYLQQQEAKKLLGLK